MTIGEIRRKLNYADQLRKAGSGMRVGDGWCICGSTAEGLVSKAHMHLPDCPAIELIRMAVKIEDDLEAAHS